MTTPTPTPGSDPAAAPTPAPSAPGVPAPAVPGGWLLDVAHARRSPTGKLGSGELCRLVAGYLLVHTGTDLTPADIARGLSDRSPGAVRNALESLAAHGQAVKTSEMPVRYRDTPTTPQASALTTVSSPRTPRPAAPRPAPTPPAAPAAPAGELTGEVAVTGVVTRPNGQIYRPRTLADLPDVTALRKLRTHGIPVLLYGPPGTGKTSLIEAAYPDLITVAGDGDTTVADFVGEYTQAPGGKGYAFVYGPLVTAMTQGRCLFIDDATLISPKVLAVVYPAMDGRRQITVKAHRGETIIAADGFFVVAGHNPGVHGAVLTEALASRFGAQVHVGSDYDLASSLKIDRRAVRVARNLASRQAAGEVTWVPQLRELITTQKIIEALGVDAAMGNLIGLASDDDRDVVAAVVESVYGKAVQPLAVGRQI